MNIQPSLSLSGEPAYVATFSAVFMLWNGAELMLNATRQFLQGQ